MSCKIFMGFKYFFIRNDNNLWYIYAMKEIAQEQILNKATFNPKVKTYIFFIVLFYLIVSIIGWVIVPFWIFGFGQWLSNKFFKTLKCELSNKNLKFSKGLIINIEKTIPLENIQDLSFIGGPILRYFGLTLIKVETAGGGGSHHSQNVMTMIGVQDADNFKKQILEEREKLILSKSNNNSTSENENLLSQIKDELVAIKNVLQEKK
jgi:putative membrane protein